MFKCSLIQVVIEGSQKNQTGGWMVKEMKNHEGKEFETFELRLPPSLICLQIPPNCLQSRSLWEGHWKCSQP